MPTASARLGAFVNESIMVTLAYNNSTNVVQSVTVANHSETLNVKVGVWAEHRPDQIAYVIAPPTETVTQANLPNQLYYSPVELPEGTPNATNIGFSFSTT